MRQTAAEIRARERIQGKEIPCPGCGRVVGYRLPRQYVTHPHPGKPRRPHKCAHGLACVFGNRYGGHGMNGPTCSGCAAEKRKAEGRA